MKVLYPLQAHFVQAVHVSEIKQKESESMDEYLPHIKLKLDMCGHAAEVRQDMTHDIISLFFGLIDDCRKDKFLHEDKPTCTAVGFSTKGKVLKTANQRYDHECPILRSMPCNAAMVRPTKQFTVEPVDTSANLDSAQRMAKNVVLSQS